jgi:hypothetical protein
VRARRRPSQWVIEAAAETAASSRRSRATSQSCFRR